MEAVETCELCMEVTFCRILVTLFFKLTNFLIMLIFLIMLRIHLMSYVGIKYGDQIKYYNLFHVYSA